STITALEDTRMGRYWAVAVALLFLAGGSLHADDPVAAALKQVKSIGKDATGSPAARKAWDELVERGPGVLPQILAAIETPDTDCATWRRTAFDRIVDQAMKDGGDAIDKRALRAFIENPKKQGRSRRLALDVLERLQPGTSRRLGAGWMDDPEFRYEAVELA